MPAVVTRTRSGGTRSAGDVRHRPATTPVPKGIDEGVHAVRMAHRPPGLVGGL